MSIVKVQGNASGTGTLTIAAPNTNTDRTLTLPDNTGTVVTTGSTAGVSQAMLASGVAGNGPAFSAYQLNGSANQSVSSDVWTKFKIDTEEFDTNSNFDTSTNRFQPTVAGYYQVNGCGYLRNSAACALKIVSIYKNGTIYKQGTQLYLTGNYYTAADTFMVSSLIYFNGSTDYVELYGYISSASASFGYGRDLCYFNASLVRAA